MQILVIEGFLAVLRQFDAHLESRAARLSLAFAIDVLFADRPASAFVLIAPVSRRLSVRPLVRRALVLPSLRLLSVVSFLVFDVVGVVPKVDGAVFLSPLLVIVGELLVEGVVGVLAVLLSVRSVGWRLVLEGRVLLRDDGVGASVGAVFEPFLIINRGNSKIRMLLRVLRHRLLQELNRIIRMPSLHMGHAALPPVFVPLAWRARILILLLVNNIIFVDLDMPVGPVCLLPFVYFDYFFFVFGHALI